MTAELNLREDATWKDRFRAPSILFAYTASANPDRGLVVSDQDGIIQLYGWDVPSGELTQATRSETGVVFGNLSSDGQYIYYLNDDGGNEIGHFARVRSDGQGEPDDLTPDLAPYAGFMFQESANGSAQGFTAATKAGSHVYVRQNGGPWRVLHHTMKQVYGPRFSADGALAILETNERSENLDSALIVRDTASGEPLRELWDGEGTSISVASAGFSPIAGDERILAQSNASGYNRPLIWNARTGERQDLDLPDIQGELVPTAWSPDAERVLLLQLWQAQHRLYLYDIDSGMATRLNHPAGVLGGYFGAATFREDEIWTTWQDSEQPSRLVALDARTGEQKRVVLAAGETPPGSKWRSAHFESPGGLIQAWVATPNNGQSGPYPTIVHVHGGPTSVMSEMFSPASQAWLDHGYAFCSINYRGSTTFGRDFEQSIWGRLGEVEVEDIEAGVNWLVEQGIADRDATLITGGSYGGYLTLMSLGTRPDLFAGGIGQVVVADWVGMYHQQAETLRTYLDGLFGGSPADKMDVYVKSSPITYVGNLKAPLLVIQGRNDTRCPAGQYEDYERAAKGAGAHIETHWFDAGHGSRDTEQQIEHMELSLRFAQRILG